MGLMRSKDGFALPTVIMASLVMMMVLSAGLSMSTSSRMALNEQYLNQLSKEASEAGIRRAEDCLKQNNYVATWSDTNPLRPNTDCSGISLPAVTCPGSAGCYVLNQTNLKTAFRVGAPTPAGGSSFLVNADGEVNILRTSNGAVSKTIQSTGSARIGVVVSFNNTVFGYNFDKLASDSAFFFALTMQGKLKALGGNAFGQLGVGDTANSTLPRDVVFPVGAASVKSIHTSLLSHGENAFFVLSDGSVYGAGKNSDGSLGLGHTTSPQSTPQRLSYYQGGSSLYFGATGNKKAKSVLVLGYSAFILTEDGYLYSAGKCDGSVLGRGCTDANRFIQMPVLSPALASTRPTVNMVTDSYSAFTITESGGVYGWGWNQYGQIANGGNAQVSQPTKIGLYGDAGQPTASQVAFDGDSFFVLDSDGNVSGAGRNDFGQLGDGTTVDKYSLTTFNLPVGAGSAVKVVTDQWSTLVLDSNGVVWGAGLNASGQLGNGNTTNQSTPVKFILPIVGGVQVKAVDVFNVGAGMQVGPGNNYRYANTYVIGDDGKVYGAGDNEEGQLGVGATSDYAATPVVMGVIDGISIRAKQVQAGFGTAIVLTENGKIYTVGNNSHGQLGDGTTNDSSTPAANVYTNNIPRIFY